MPPWKADPLDGPFVGQHPLTDAEISLIQQWSADGAPEGDSAPTRVAAKWTEGWQLGKPDLVVTALRLGTGDSLEFVKALKAERPALLILVYSAFEEAIFAERTLRAGADGYVMKTAPKEEFLGAIRDVLNGNIYVSRDVAMRAFKKSLESRSDHRSAPSATGIEKLSDREMHIFNLLGSGLGNTQIAHSLSLSVKTIESHRENIKRKLDLSCSRDLIACAKKYVEETFLPAAKGALAITGKKKVVRFPAA